MKASVAGTIKAFLRKRLRFFDLRYMRPIFACGCVEGSAFPAAEISLRQDRGDLARDLAGFRGEMNVVAHGLLLRGEAPLGGSAVDVAGKGGPPAERKRCESPPTPPQRRGRRHPQRFPFHGRPAVWWFSSRRTDCLSGFRRIPTGGVLESSERGRGRCRPVK